MEETREQRIDRQFKELGRKVNDIFLSYICNDGFNREEAEKAMDDVCWMLQTKPYREYNLEWLELMQNCLSEANYTKDCDVKRNKPKYCPDKEVDN